jgi:hypothetical protein
MPSSNTRYGRWPVATVFCVRPYDMGKLFAFIGATIGSYAGWILGARIGFTTAFILSMIGTGLGIYYGRRIAQHYGG